MAPLAQRLAGARAVAGSDRRIRVTDIEARLGTSYTVDTVAALKQRFSRTRFVWLMGADNLRQIPHWERWTEIFELVPIAVLARPTYCLSALAGLAAQRFAKYRLNTDQARNLADTVPPAWVFFAARLEPLSATALRTEKRRNVFARRVRHS